MIKTKTSCMYAALFICNALLYGMRQSPVKNDDVKYETEQITAFNHALQQGDIATAESALSSLKVLTKPRANIKDLEKRLERYKMQKSSS